MFGVESIRKISVERGKEQQVQKLEIPREGLNCYLPSFGEVRVFKQLFKEEYRYYIMYLPEQKELDQLNERDFKTVHDAHWEIEQYHRVLKQVCNVESFQVRGERPIRNHFFSAVYGYVKLALLKASGKIANCYEIQRTLFCEVIAKFIRDKTLLSLV